MKTNIAKIFLLTSLVFTGLVVTSLPSLAAEESTRPTRGHITGKTVVGGLLSLIIWPGIGQAVNDSPGDKVLTHAVVGLLPPFRFWSGYDALYDRRGGYWKGKV